MASNETPSELVQKNNTELLPHDVREIEAVTQYAKKQEKEIENLTDDVDKMGILQRFWDSKVPQKDKRFYHFFTFTASNKEDVKAEIEKYLDFYQQMCTVVSKINNGEGTEEEKGNYEIILELYESLTELAAAAEAGKKTTASSMVCEQHRRFILKHEKLENMIKRVECVSLKQSWKKASDGLQQSLKAIDGLRNDLQVSESKYDDICDKFDELLHQNKKLIKQQNFLLEENAQIMMQQQILMEDNKQMKEQTQLLVGIIAAIAKESEKNKTSENSSNNNKD